MTPRWTPVEVFPESALAWTACVASEEEDGWGWQVLRMRFEGVHRPGSAGTPDAGLMRAVTAAAVAHVRPDVVLLDLAARDHRRGTGASDSSR